MDVGFRRILSKPHDVLVLGLDGADEVVHAVLLDDRNGVVGPHLQAVGLLDMGNQGCLALAGSVEVHHCILQRRLCLLAGLDGHLALLCHVRQTLAKFHPGPSTGRFLAQGTEVENKFAFGHVVHGEGREEVGHRGRLLEH